MELNRSIVSWAGRLLPGWLKGRLDVVEHLKRQHLDLFRKSLPPGARVLDACCGENTLKGTFPGTFFVGYDRGIGDARWDYGAVDVLGNVEALSFRDASFDAVLLIVSLEHVRNPYGVVGEIARVLKPGGAVFCIAPLLWEVHQAPHDYYRYTIHGLEHLFSAHGLSLDRRAPLGGFFTVAARRSVNALGFFQRSWRWPFFFLLAPLFGFLLPLALRLFDGLDREKNYTLGYIVTAKKGV